jgi:hypothetical protein
MTMADKRFIALTDTRRQILELAQSKGAISASDVALNIIRGRNLRAATKALKDLHALGLLMPIRTCEYRLSPAGQERLDSIKDLDRDGQKPAATTSQGGQ